MSENASWLGRLRRGLGRTSDKLKGGIAGLLAKGKLDPARLTELEEVLIAADLGQATAARLTRSLGQNRRAADLGEDEVREVLAREIAQILTPVARPLTVDGERKPHVILVCGVNGSGKTTTIAKLAKGFTEAGLSVVLAACDTFRAAAVEQLQVWGERVGCPVISGDPGADASGLAFDALEGARRDGADVLLIDTAGRLHNKADLMAELQKMVRALAKIDGGAPHDRVLVMGAGIGQNAHNQVRVFVDMVGVTGLVLTKLDGDARGGAALSVSSVTGLPIKFIGNGEKPEAFEAYHPDRLASRILGMGDMATLIEKAQETIDEDQAKALEQKLRKATFDLEDFLGQLGQVKKMGSLTNMLDMIPGGKFLRAKIPTASLDDRQFAKVEAIILSMTPLERHKPELIGGSRRKRIANGSGTTPADVNRLLNQFDQMRKMMKRMASGRMKGMPQFPGMMR